VLYGGRIRRFREKFNNSETDDPKALKNSELVIKLVIWTSFVF
jgi:hypothetical protein